MLRAGERSEHLPKILPRTDPEPDDIFAVPFADSPIAAPESDGPEISRTRQFLEAQARMIRVLDEEVIRVPGLRADVCGKLVIEPPECAGARRLHNCAGLILRGFPSASDSSNQRARFADFTGSANSLSHAASSASSISSNVVAASCAFRNRAKSSSDACRAGSRLVQSAATASAVERVVVFGMASKIVTASRVSKAILR